MEQLISHLWVALVDTLSSLPDAEGGVLPVSEVHKLLLKIHDILDKAVSKLVGNSARILSYLFNSVSRQHCVVWASQFPFLDSLRDVIPPSEACLYGCINWSLAQAHSMGLSQSFPPKRGDKARPWTAFHFTVQKRLCQGLCQGLVGGMGVSIPDVPESSASSASSSSTSAAFQLGILFKFFNQWRSITSKRFVLNMVQGCHLQLRSCPPLFCNFWQFNVKAAAAHLPVIQREADELLAKGAIEPSSGGASFYLSMFVVPKHTGGLQPIVNLIIICIYLLLRCLLLDRSGSLYSVVIMLFPLIYKMLIYIFLLLSMIIISYILFGIMYLINGRFYLLGWPQPLGFLLPPTRPILFLCHCKGLCIVIYLDDILVLVALSRQVRGHALFLCSLSVHLGFT